MHLGIPDRAAGREEGGCGTAAARDIHVGSLGNNGIDADGMTVLADALPQCMSLQALSYACRRGGDSVISYFWVHALGSLNSNNIGADGVSVLAAAMPQCKTLQTL